MAMAREFPAFVRAFHELVQTAGTIEQGILGVQVQMDKVCVRHESSLASPQQQTKRQSFGQCT